MENLTLPEQMVRFRAKHRLSQRDFAKLCDVSVQTVCSVETGQQTPGKITAEKIKIAMEEYVDES